MEEDLMKVYEGIYLFKKVQYQTETIAKSQADNDLASEWVIKKHAANPKGAGYSSEVRSILFPYWQN